MGHMGFIQDELDLKMLVLYLMARVAAPISFLQLLELALCDAGVDYFSLVEAVEELRGSGHLELQEERYSITPKGLRDSAICEDSLTYSVRCRCDANLAKLNASIEWEAQVQSSVEPRADGSCDLRLRLSDDHGELMDMSVFIPSVQSGTKLSQRFQEHPERFYLAVIAALDGLC